MKLTKAPTPVVTAIASAPQKVTRSAPVATTAPPARAAAAPRSASEMSYVTATIKMRWPGGANTVTRSGKAAPIAKLAADASAA